MTADPRSSRPASRFATRRTGSPYNGLRRESVEAATLSVKSRYSPLSVGVSHRRTAVMAAKLSTAADLRAVFPQKFICFPRIQANRDLAEVHEADRASGQKPAFTEDLDARVLIKGKPPTCPAHHY